jgi:hypothetical protein
MTKGPAGTSTADAATTHGLSPRKKIRAPIVCKCTEAAFDWISQLVYPKNCLKIGYQKKRAAWKNYRNRIVIINDEIAYLASEIEHTVIEGSMASIFIPPIYLQRVLGFERRLGCVGTRLCISALKRISAD